MGSTGFLVVMAGPKGILKGIFSMILHMWFGRKVRILSKICSPFCIYSCRGAVEQLKTIFVTRLECTSTLVFPFALRMFSKERPVLCCRENSQSSYDM